MRLGWSNLAKAELLALQRFSVERWGHDTTRRYLEAIGAAAKQVAEEPGRARLLKGRFRIIRVRSHYLIVDVDSAADRVTIARVIHTAMDIERHLP